MLIRKTLLSLILITGLLLANQKVIPPYNPGYWEDLRFSASSAKQGQSDKPAFDFTNIGLTFPANDETHIMYINAQMPHAWRQTAISSHVHFAQTTDKTPIFALAYRWYSIGTPCTANFTIITTNVLAMPYTGGTIHQLADFPDINPPSNPNLSSMLDIKVYRKTGDGAAANVLLKEFDIHYEVDQPGSRLEFTK